MRCRGAFTLIEILVSLMIFSIVGVAMLGIMFMATELYRSGETGRAANDESVAVMAALDDDIARMVPHAAGGWVYVDVSNPGVGNGTIADADPDGGTLLAFKITRRDRSQVQASGEGTQTIVAWWVDKNRQLRRAERAVPPRTTVDHDDDFDALELMVVDASIRDTWPIITTGCLHFSAYLSTDVKVRLATSDWSSLDAIPQAGPPHCTGPEHGMAFPEAIRVTTVLTGGGRFAPTGFLVSKMDKSSTDAFRIAGIKALPTASGAMLRVDDEWIGYDGYNGKAISMTGTDPWVGRGRRRSSDVTHDPKAVVRLGYTHSLVRILR